jgi:hypothetical protein
MPDHIISTTIDGKNSEPKRVSCDSLSLVSLLVCMYACCVDVWMNVVAASARMVVSLLVWYLLR